MRICVLGLSHLGSVTAACLARLGHEVVGLDFDAAAIARLSRAVAPALEPGLEDLLRDGLASGRLRFTTALEEAVGEAELLWVAYDTATSDGCGLEPQEVLANAARVLGACAAGVTVLLSSQLPPGSVRELEQAAAAGGTCRADIACCPENLRLGRAVADFLHAERFVVGIRAGAPRERIERLLSSVGARIEWMSVESAEVTKHALNAYLATSVVFANEVAALCESLGADAKEVERGLRSDSRIGTGAYLAPGAAFAGGTLARGLEQLTAAAHARRVDTPLLTAALRSNEQHRYWARQRLQALFPDLASRRVAIWGLSYKPGTDSLRGSLAVQLCEWLLAAHATVRVHDPAAGALPVHWQGRVDRCADPLAAVAGADALVIATPWPAYREFSAAQLRAASPHLAVLDADRVLPRLGSEPALRYLSVGLGGRAP